MSDQSFLSRRRLLQNIGAAAMVSQYSRVPTAKAASANAPNIVFILCDDLGYGDLECYGSQIHTPNLNRLASEGIRFSNFCSADPVCSPSRAALLTGRYPTRVGVPRVLFPQDQGGLNLDEVTLANILKDRGYKTACVGKWHLGRPKEYMPTSRGFDEYFGIPYSNDMTPSVLVHNTEIVEEPVNLETLTARYTQHATDFIRRSQGSPFFLYLPHTFPHIPLAASPRFQGRSAQGLYGDVIEELDWSVGEVVRTLRELGIEKNTLLMFSSDNGPWYQGSPGKLRGRKDSTYEGGVREPFIASWPGQIPAGRLSNALASMADIFPTVAKLCHAQLPAKPLDGIDIWPLLSGQVNSLDRPPLLYFNQWNLQCVRWNHWKLHVARYNTAPYVPAPPGGVKNYILPHPELYNLSNDPNESYDIADQHPDVVEKMEGLIAEMIKTFPQPVQEAYAESKTRKADPTTPTGAWPKPAQILN
jgi:arylsulfatase A